MQEIFNKSNSMCEEETKLMFQGNELFLDVAWYAEHFQLFPVFMSSTSNMQQDKIKGINWLVSEYIKLKNWYIIDEHLVEITDRLQYVKGTIDIFWRANN